VFVQTNKRIDLKESLLVFISSPIIEQRERKEKKNEMK